MQHKMRPLFLSLILIASVLSTGCSYMHNRGADAIQMFDIGITVSPLCKPGLAAYVGVPGSIALGGAYVPDAKIFGIGNNQAGWLDYEHKSYGALLWGSSKQGAGEFDPKDVYQAREDQRNLTKSRASTRDRFATSLRAIPSPRQPSLCAINSFMSVTSVFFSTAASSRLSISWQAGRRSILWTMTKSEFGD